MCLGRNNSTLCKLNQILFVNIKEAIVLYEKLRTDYPDSPFAGRALYKLGWCHYLLGETEQAKAKVSAFLQSPANGALVGDAAFLLGTIMVSQGDYESAYEEFRLVAEKYADSEFGAEALYRGGECLAQLGRTDEAAKLFERFAAAYPDNILAEQAILRSGDAELLSAAFDEAVQKYETLLQGEVDPTIERDTLYRLAITYHNMKDYEASANTFRRLAEKHPTDSHVSEAYLRIGDFYLRDGKDVVKALEAYNASLAADPSGSFAGRAVKGIALARHQTKDYDEAVLMFLRLMTEFPSVPLNEDTYAWVGQRLFDAKRWDDAAVAFRALLTAKPDYPNPERVLFRIGECDEVAGRTDDALKLFQEVADLAPRSSIAAQARLRMAKLHEDAGRGVKS